MNHMIRGSESRLQAPGRAARWPGTGLTWVLLAGLAGPLAAQEPLTRAERSSWLETSRYEDVVSFIDSLETRDAGNVLHVTAFGYTVEGRRLPLVVVGKGLAGGDAAAVRAAGRVRVLVQANIHAGEVEGKEALQMLLRRLAAGRHGDWLDSLIVLVAPIYNADGNERISVFNRSRQSGPLGGVGQRENAQGLDLNRDHMKLESPEARSLVGLFEAYDPHLAVDLHTTNGTRHAYHLTYSPPLHPDTDSRIVELLRGELLPFATDRIRQEGWLSFYYGNAYAPGGGERGWYTFDYRPRFNNNYVGLRNRFAVLSEAYSYAPFEDRVRATLSFVEAILEFTSRNRARIEAAVAEADGEDLRERRLPLRADVRRGPEVEILMGETENRLSRYSGREYSVRLDVRTPERMRDYGTFRPTLSERVPAAYYVPASAGGVADLLAFHGVRTERLEQGVRRRVERFAVDSTALAPREFQGHWERELWGHWVEGDVDLEAGTLIVPMDQPLARLAFHLLEPRSPDGAAAWNLLDDALDDDPASYPILRAAGPED